MIMKIRSAQFIQGVYDYSAWDDMVAYVAKHDSIWEVSNLTYTCTTLGVNSIAIFNKNFELIFEEHDSSGLAWKELQISDSMLRASFHKRNEMSFFIRSPKGLFQVFGSIIVPTLDINRRTTPQGYTVTGILWDSAYIQDTENATLSDIKIRPSSWERNLKDIDIDAQDAFNNNVAIIQFIPRQSIKPEIDNRLYYFTLIPLLLSLSVILLFFFMLRRWITNPLQNFKASLDNDNPQFLKQISQGNHEFLNVAKALEESFESKKRLESEIQERKRAQATIQMYSRQLEESNISKDKFFSILAHDLKSPFHALLGYSEILRTDFDQLGNEERRKFIEIIYQSSKIIYDLLENLLQWAKLQTGKMTITPVLFDISREADSVIDLLQGQAIKKRIEIKSLIPEITMVYADNTMVKIILQNIINNAIKFTPLNGEVTLEAVLREYKHMEIRITDTGVGIAPEDLKQLFRIDAQFTRKGTANETGTGLGLILCKEFTEKNGGKIWVDSMPGKGSTFFFTLPVQPGKS